VCRRVGIGIGITVIALLLPNHSGGVRAAEPQAPSTPAAADPLLAKVVGSLERAEAVFQSYVVRSDLDFYDDGVKKKTMTFALAISSDSTVALFRSPAYDAGKVVLFNGDGYFLYFPGPDHYIRVSPSNSLYGNISFGDIVKPPLLRYYQIEKTRREGEHIEISFVLKPGVTLPYYKKVARIDLKRDTVEEIGSYSRSGILLGRTVNLEFTKIAGVLFPTYCKIFDVKSPNSFAYQRSSSVKSVDLPKKLFNPSFLREVEAYLQRRLGM
jgi:hypothetical protein